MSMILEQGFCVKANVSKRALKIWAHDEDIKKAAYKSYRKNVLMAKGVKSGAKFQRWPDFNFYLFNDIMFA